VINLGWLASTLYIATVVAAPTEPPAAGIAQAGQQPFDPPTKCGSPAAISKSAVGFPEARAVGTNAEAWALFFSPLDANRRVKIVWRMTGSGRFAVVAFKPNRKPIEPESPPVSHTSSTWQRSGDEWGTWFTFPEPGCWDLHVSRDGSSADLWIDVK